MISKRALFLQFVYVTGISVYAANDCLDCPVAVEYIDTNGNFTYAMNFVWNCSLPSNQSVFLVQWMKEEEQKIASVANETFTPDDSFAGRVKRFGTFGISLYNISINDSGHYKVHVLGKGPKTISEYFPCQIIFLPVLPQSLTGFHAGNAKRLATDNDPTKCSQAGLSKLEIGLICGIFLVAVTGLGVGLVACYFRHRRRKKKDTETKIVSPEMEMLNKRLS